MKLSEITKVSELFEILDTMEYYIFLNRLRENGATNMFGAAPYLQKSFGLDRKTASNVLTSWMHWVSDNPDNRNL